MGTSVPNTGAENLFGYIVDQETRVDLLRNEAIASTVIELLTAGLPHSITIGVHGDWGAGKSSVLHMIEAAFEEGGAARDPGHLCIRFNGWEFQGFEDAKIALIEGVVTQLVSERSLATKAADEVRNVLARIDLLKLAKRAGGIAFNMATGMPSPDQVGAVLDFIRSKLEDPSDLVTKENAEAVVAEAKALWKDPPPTKSVPKELKEFREAFARLVDKAGVTRLVVLVDDLDRCLPETAIQTLEAIRLFVSLPKTAFVIGADEAMIEYAVRRHFADLPETGPSKGYPKAYLEKLIQVPFRIPAMGETETRIYVTLLLVGSLTGQDSPGFRQLMAVARDRMSKPWSREAVTDDDARAALGDEWNPRVARAVAMAGRISGVLARGSEGNPRQVKRFVNALNLRLRVSNARGFGAAIDADVLAKLMLAEMYHPDLFEHVALSAAAAEDGRSAELAALERAARSDGDAKDPEAAGVAGAPDAADRAAPGETAGDGLVEGWLTNEGIRKWAAEDPQIGADALTPYLFVVNDRKAYVGRGRPLSPELRKLLALLTGTRIELASAKPRLAGLPPGDIESLFETLRGMLLTAKGLRQAPPAAGALRELSAAHPQYQGRLVDALSDLRPADLGAWAGSAFEGALAGAAADRFEGLKARWRREGSPRLMAALEPGPGD